MRGEARAFLSMKPLIFDGYQGDDVRSFWDMKRAGIELCILKVSQNLRLDSKFIDYARRAAETGMQVGGYHFGGNGDGADQADLYMSRLKPGQLMCLDFERYPKSQMTVTQAEEFVLRCKAKTGNIPVLYYGELLIELEAKRKISQHSILRSCPAWISRYGPKQPVAIGGHDLVMWQYTGDGVGPEPHSVAGVNNSADLSVWVGNPADIPRFVAKHSYQEVACDGKSA